MVSAFFRKGHSEMKATFLDLVVQKPGELFQGCCNVVPRQELEHKEASRRSESGKSKTCFSKFGFTGKEEAGKEARWRDLVLIFLK